MNNYHYYLAQEWAIPGTAPPVAVAWDPEVPARLVVALAGTQGALDAPGGGSPGQPLTDDGGGAVV